MFGGISNLDAVLGFFDDLSFFESFSSVHVYAPPNQATPSTALSDRCNPAVYLATSLKCTYNLILSFCFKRGHVDR